jgi:hypothetical protein
VEHLPAIMVVAVDVEDLLALDTEDTRDLLASCLLSPYGQHMLP